MGSESKIPINNQKPTSCTENGESKIDYPVVKMDIDDGSQGQTTGTKRPFDGEWVFELLCLGCFFLVDESVASFSCTRR